MSRHDGGKGSVWAAFRCTSCGGIVTAKGKEDQNSSTAPIVEVLPEPKEVSDTLPERAKKYLEQAMKTLTNPTPALLCRPPPWMRCSRTMVW